jgi:hypothetical protein
MIYPINQNAWNLMRITDKLGKSIGSSKDYDYR